MPDESQDALLAERASENLPKAFADPPRLPDSPEPAVLYLAADGTQTPMIHSPGTATVAWMTAVGGR